MRLCFQEARRKPSSRQPVLHYRTLRAILHEMFFLRWPTYACAYAGACAGAWAVMCSMPADCIKTRLELTATRTQGGVLTNLGLIMGTARTMIKQEGLQSMFVGMGPRLAHAIPSAMVYWLAVEACRRALEPVTCMQQKPQTQQESSLAQA